MGDTPIITMRLNPDLLEWLGEYAKQFLKNPDRPKLGTVDRSLLIRELLEALRDRRLATVATPAPFTINNGSDPAFPVLVCHKPN